jgi:hypothetical protein
MADQDAERLELLRSALESAKDTIKACLLINSGAAVALVAFTGHLVTEKSSLNLISGLLPSLNWFVAGIVTAALAHGCSYVTNLRFWSGGWQRAQWYRIIVVFFIFASICSFIRGSYSAYSAFSPEATKPTPTIQPSK